MTTREMVTNLMTECLEDAVNLTTLTTEKKQFPPAPHGEILVAAAALAAAMFRVRWQSAAMKLLDEVEAHRGE